MPALPNVPAVIRVACKGVTGGGELWLTRFYLRYPAAPPNNTQLANLGGAVATAWQSHLSPLVSGNKTLVEVDLADLTTPTSSAVVVPTSHVGTRVGGWLPPAACAVVGYTVARRYRGGHPRGYLPFGVEEDIDTSGQWLPISLGEYNTGIAGFFADVTAFIWGVSEITNHVNVSYYSGFTVVTDPITGRARNVPTVRPTGPLVDNVTSTVARSIIGTQRRRGQF